MTIQNINIGVNANDGTGDDLRTAFLKVNDNFQFLAGRGGETNTGANLGGGEGQLFSGKTNETLNFRTLAHGPGITVNQVGNVITIASTIAVQPSITTFGASEGSPYTAYTAGERINILGEGNITTSIVGQNLTINGAFELSNDIAPTLSASLTLNGWNIVGTGNINVNGTLAGTGITVNTATINTSLTVNGTVNLANILAETINANTSITSQRITATTYGFIGSLTGNTTGTHYGNVSVSNLGQVDGDGNPLPDTVVVNAETQTITGSHFGSFSGEFSGTVVGSGVALNGKTISGIGKIELDGTYTVGSSPIVVNSKNYSSPIAIYDTPTINYGADSVILTMEQQTFGMSEPLRLRTISKNSNQNMPLGGGIAFETINLLDPTAPGYVANSVIEDYDVPAYQLQGYIGVMNYLENPWALEEVPPPTFDTTFSTFVARVREPRNGSIAQEYLKDIIKARGDGRVSIADIDINNSYIMPSQVPLGVPSVIQPRKSDMVLTNLREDYYVNFYGTTTNVGTLDNPDIQAVGGYSFPKEIGTPGQVLQVRAVSGTRLDNVLEWVTVAGGGGGGGGVTDFLNLTDTPNAYASKNGYIVRVRNDAGGLEFTNAITATLTGDVIGNASTATSFQNSRTINGLTYNGTANIIIDSSLIPEYSQSALNADVAGTTGEQTSTTITVNESDVAGTLSNGAYFVEGMRILGTGITGDAVITNVASLAGVITLTVSFSLQEVFAETDIAITADVYEKWYSATRVRNDISVVADKALTFDSSTGEFDLNESTTNVADTLVKRDGSGVTTLGVLKINNLQTATINDPVTISSPLNVQELIESSADITTTETLSAGFIALTGTGDQTLASSAKLILSPATSVDVSNKKIVNLADPTNDQEAATKKYVDDSSDAVYTASLQSIPYAGDSGTPLDYTKGETFRITGGSNIVTSTTINGVQVSFATELTDVTIGDDLNVNGDVTTLGVNAGNIRVALDTVSQTVSTKDLNLVPGSGGKSVVVSGGDFKIVGGRFALPTSDTMEFPTNSLSQAITLTTQTTFIRTITWADSNAGLAVATLPNGFEGQTKTIIMANRGTYGAALDTRPRYLTVTGIINGASRTVSIAATDPNGSSSFIFLNNSWWRTSHVA